MKEEMKSASHQSSRQEYVPADFRKIIEGNQGKMPWKPMFSGDFNQWSLPRIGKGYTPIEPDTTPKGWEIVGETGIVGEDYEDGTNLAFGEASWRHIELSMLITPLKGGNAQIYFRMDNQAESWYVFDLMLGWQVAAIHKIDRVDGMPHQTRLSAVNFPIEWEREYPVQIAARGNSITTYIDGVLVNQVTDAACPCGCVALNIWESKTLYRDMQYRILDEVPIEC